MQVNLEQADVEKAIALFLRSMGITATVDEVSFKAGRSGSGLTTSVKLVDTQHAPIPQQANTTGIPAGPIKRSTETQAYDAKPMQQADETSDEGSEEETPDKIEEESNDTSESLFK